MNKEHSLFEDLRQLTTRLPKWLGKVLHAHDESLLDLSDAEFKKLVEILFIKREFEVDSACDISTGEIDMILRRDENKTLLVYRYWREQSPGIQMISCLQTAMQHSDISSGIFISCSSYSREMIQAARAAGIMLIDGADLSRMTDDLLSRHDEQGRERTTEPANEAVSSDPVCPECGAEMIKRVAHRGKFAGRTFWGCSQYPDCKGIVNDR